MTKNKMKEKTQSRNYVINNIYVFSFKYSCTYIYTTNNT